MEVSVAERCERCRVREAVVICDVRPGGEGGERICAECCNPEADFAGLFRGIDKTRRCGLCECPLAMTERDNHDLCSECTAWIEANPRLRGLMPCE